MHKIVLITLSLLLECHVFSYGQNVISINAGGTAAGDTGTFVITMKNSVAVNGLNIILEYEPALIKPNRITPTSRLTSFSGSSASLFGDDKISFLVYDTGPTILAADSGAIFDVEFTVSDSLRDSTITQLVFTEGTVADSSVALIPFAYIDGVIPLSPTVGVQDPQTAIPVAFSLEQNYPNPFNPVTAIRYSVPVQGYVSLKVFDILGRQVAVLVSEVKQPGIYTSQWIAHDKASGVYFYRFEVTGPNQPGKIYTNVKKAILIK